MKIEKSTIAMMVFGGYMGGMTSQYGIGYLDNITTAFFTNIIPILLASLYGVLSRN